MQGNVGVGQPLGYFSSFPSKSNHIPTVLSQSLSQLALCSRVEGKGTFPSIVGGKRLAHIVLYMNVCEKPVQGWSTSPVFESPTAPQITNSTTTLKSSTTGKNPKSRPVTWFSSAPQQTFCSELWSHDGNSFPHTPTHSARPHSHVYNYADSSSFCRYIPFENRSSIAFYFIGENYLCCCPAHLFLPRTLLLSLPMRHC